MSRNWTRQFADLKGYQRLPDRARQSHWFSTATPKPNLLHVRTLGGLRQTNDDDARALRRKPLALLSYVARRSPSAVTRTELATLFWGERGEERARQSLRQALLELKQVLADRIDIDPDSVRVAAGVVDLDIVAFEHDLSDGRVTEAIARWSGD